MGVGGERMKNEQIIEAMKKGLVVATGCTEPVAIAYAGAVARSHIAGEIAHIKLVASANIIKNAFVVGIPGTDLTGLKYAVAIGCMCTEPEKKLAVLEGLSKAQVVRAKQLVEQDKVELDKSDLPYKLYIEVTVKTKADVVIASRYQKGAEVKGLSKLRIFTSEGARYVYSLILNVKNVKDYTCGYRLYKKSSFYKR
jgi:L-cysteine desulfidase